MPQRQSAPQDKPVYETDITVGEILRRERIRYDQSIEDIERVLHIRGQQLEAIEGNQFDKLPGPVYAMGFIRTYAEYMGLDGDKMVALFKSQTGTRITKKPELHFPVAAEDTRMPRTWVTAASLVLAVGILVLWWRSESHDRSVVTAVPPVSSLKEDAVASALPAGPPAPNGLSVSTSQAALPEANAQSAQAMAAVSSPPSAGETNAEAAAAQDGIILKITQNSWVEIKDSSGKAVVSRVLRAGDKYFVPSRPDLLMSLGNSGGVELEVGGQNLAPLGEPGEVLRNIPLDGGFLKKRFSKTIANPVQ